MSNQSRVRNIQTNKRKKDMKVMELNHTKHTIPVCLGLGFPTLCTNPRLTLVVAVSRIEKLDLFYKRKK